MALGEVVFDDASYTGETGSSVFSLQYYRNKAREFQTVLDSVDAAALAAENLIAADVDDELSNDLLARLDEYQSKKWTFKATAEAINAAAATINAVGGRFPQLSIPSGTLGAVPLLLPAAGVAAIAVAATLIAWGVTWLNGMNERLKLAQYAANIEDPDKKAALMTALATTESAASAASGSGLSNIAGVVKWGAVAFLAYMAFQAFQTTQTRKGK